MTRIQRNIFLLTLTMLFIGLQLSRSEMLYNGDSDIKIVQYEGQTIILPTVVNAMLTSNSFHTKDQKLLVIEMHEEIEEVNDGKTVVDLFISHDYFTSFLDFRATRSDELFKYFDASSLVSSLPLYLQHEVFRL